MTGSIILDCIIGFFGIYLLCIALCCGVITSAFIVHKVNLMCNKVMGYATGG